MNFKEIRWECVDWMHLAHDRVQRRDLMNMVMNLRVPLKAGNLVGTSHKAKVKLSLCLTKHRAMKTFWGVEV
jgi:hypothetical protein